MIKVGIIFLLLITTKFSFSTDYSFLKEATSLIRSKLKQNYGRQLNDDCFMERRGENCKGLSVKFLFKRLRLFEFLKTNRSLLLSV